MIDGNYKDIMKLFIEFKRNSKEIMKLFTAGNSKIIRSIKRFIRSIRKFI